MKTLEIKMGDNFVTLLAFFKIMAANSHKCFVFFLRRYSFSIKKCIGNVYAKISNYSSHINYSFVAEIYRHMKIMDIICSLS